MNKKPSNKEVKEFKKSIVAAILGGVATAIPKGILWLASVIANAITRPKS